MDAYVQQLADAVAAVVPAWLTHCVVETSRRQTGGCTPELATEAAAMAIDAAPRVIEALMTLLATDVDEQRTNPLSILRGAIRYPTDLLERHAIRPVRRDDFARHAFPNDHYGLSPATWADVDQSLQEPGLIWGAWKAKTVLDRRRSDGR